MKSKDGLWTGIGSYGYRPFPLIVVEEGPEDIAYHKLAIEWHDGRVIRDFGSVLN